MVLLTACSNNTPPKELAPDGNIVTKAITIELNLSQKELNEHLISSKPELDISNINVSKLESLFIDNLPGYHLQGTYNLKIKLPHQQVTQKKNLFELYLQRQVEGKTWRLIRRETRDGNEPPQWYSYFVD